MSQQRKELKLQSPISSTDESFTASLPRAPLAGRGRGSSTRARSHIPCTMPSIRHNSTIQKDEITFAKERNLSFNL